MTIEATESTELEAQRAELQALLQSKHFSRAPKLASLLSYLCEKVFADEAHQIKEYSIGLEVFHRGASFDQDSDSIVRVEANRLRRRLAEYYAEEGSSHPLQITIPVGQYVPRFEPRVQQPAEIKPISIDSASSPSQVGRIFRRRWWLIPALALLVVALVGAWIHFRPLRQPKALVEEKESAAIPGESQFGPPVGQEVRILAGAGRSFVDHAGQAMERR